MQPTIAEILALPVVAAGFPEYVGGGSLDRPVRWVHIADVDDMANMLQGGELLLTTGRAFAVTASRPSYLRGLADAGASGLIVELGTYVHAVPEHMQSLAEAADLPIIFLHSTIRFVDVTEAVHRRIVADQYDELQFAQEAHETFTRLSMQRASFDAIVDAVSVMIGQPVVLEDLTRQVVVFAPHGHRATDVLHDWERRSRLTPNDDATTFGGPEGWLTTPVGPERQQWGRLIVPVSSIDSARARVALERGSQALTLTRMAEKHLTSLEQHAQTGLVDELRRGRGISESEALARATALGLQASPNYVALTIRVEAKDPGDEVQLHRRQLRMLDEIRHSIRAGWNTALTGNSRLGQIDVLLAVPSSDGLDELLSAVAQRIHGAVGRIEGVVRCSIGVGPITARLLDAARDLAMSAHVAEVALSLPPHARHFHRLQDTRLRGLISMIRNDPRVQAFAEAELGRILDHVARHGTDEMDVLREFLLVGGNKTVLAKRMHLSRPTLYAKLSAVERLIGGDLDDAEARLSLHAALLVLDGRIA
ncbi:PucR family transcriptional regulator [Mycolicibacterium goodii]|uniref:PucR family transcriptional regulator n=1 Tax=Mycolicibacterium goodii TaxID=134601 RepID=UPI000C2687AF|nr:PucR family transcriptional regulator [Mycolicibacterium goodii]PJK20441.1 PucR family transcriptional regulator [Mycolicibacterium goodii]